MNDLDYGRCEGCGVLIPLKYLKEDDGKLYCYYCFKKYAKKLNLKQEVKK